ncbi:MAG: gliding motility lipoprotein GldD [Bacteroidota bacterium]|jgi:gliding motility-associated lipoprotein GldD
MKNCSALLILLCFVAITLVSCSDNPTPKPKGYFRISLPKKGLKTYDGTPCPYSFSIPNYSEILPYKDSLAQPCWKYLRFPDFDCDLFLSYKKINGDLPRLLEESRTLVYKHTLKAESIEESSFVRPGESFGILYDIGGSAASPIQFFVTDSANHFLRGALYFNVAPQPDSLAPVIKFLRDDIVTLMETVEWK